MLDTFNFLNILKTGGVLFIFLSLAGIISWILIFERILYFKKYTTSPLEAVKSVLSHNHSNEKNKSLGYRGSFQTQQDLGNPVLYVLHECVNISLKNKEDERYFEEVKIRAITEKLPEIQKYINIQATLGTVSPYLGLLGTIFGIIRAFMDMAQKNSNVSTSTMSLTHSLNSGIAEALIATAMGLCVAIPATIAYNYFTKEVEKFVSDIEIATSYLKASLLGYMKLD